MNNLTTINPADSADICTDGNFISLTEQSSCFNIHLACFNIKLENSALDDLLNVKRDLVSFIDDETIIAPETLDSPFETLLREFRTRGTELRKILECAEKDYEEHKLAAENDVAKINAFIVFATGLSNIPSEHSQLLTESVNVLLKDINNPDNITRVKKAYSEARNNYVLYLKELLAVNNLNIGNKCSICFTNIVESYYNPCGHTICNECDRFEIGATEKCPICRTDINSKNKLYFTSD